MNFIVGAPGPRLSTNGQSAHQPIMTMAVIRQIKPIKNMIILEYCWFTYYPLVNNIRVIQSMKATNKKELEN